MCKLRAIGRKANATNSALCLRTKKNDQAIKLPGSKTLLITLLHKN